MESEILTEVSRGPIVESKHRGHIAVTNADGQLLYFNGNPNEVTFARSSMKPLQAIPIVETGAAKAFRFADADLSLACASHNGEKQHTNRVKDILSRLDLSIDSLKCGTHPPRWREADEELMRMSAEITEIYNNCSGKHSGMLATARHMDEDTGDYYKIEHPVQQRILEVISDLTEIKKENIQIGIDGCGVPVHGVPLKSLALAFAKMAAPNKQPESRKKAIEQVTKAMIQAPEMVAGTDRFCTDLMRVANGRLFGKVGAEGVYCIGDLETGIGIALKIEDGGGRATSPAAVEVLQQLGLLTEVQFDQLKDYHYPKLKNARKEEIGEIRPVFQLKNAKD